MPRPKTATLANNDIARCLLPLLDALGWRGDQAHLQEAMPHLPESMSLNDVLNTLANLKFEGRLIPTRLRRIEQRATPCLFMPDDGGSPLVVVAAGAEMLLAFDGASGEFRHLPGDNRKGWAALFTAMDKSAHSLLMPQQEWFRKVMTRFRPVVGHAVLISLLVSVLSFVAPLFVGFIYDGALVSGSPDSLLYLGAGMMFFVLADAGFRFLRSHLFLYVSNRLGNIIGNEVFRRLMFLPPAFTETANVGAQVARIKDFETVREFFGGQALIALFELPFMLLLVVALLFVGGRVALVPLGAILLFVAFGFAVTPSVRRNNQAVAQSGSDKQSFVLEVLTNMRAIRCAGAMENWRARYRDISLRSAWNAYSMARLNGLINAFSYGLVTFSGLATLMVGVRDVTAGAMTLGTLAASMMLVWRILAPLGTGFGVFTQIGRIVRSIAQVDRLMAMSMENRQEANMRIERQFRGLINFADVSIRYQPDAPAALLNVSFNLEPGKVLVLVGHDGAGKTTVLKLILGLYAPQVGRVLLDNVNLRQIDPIQLRHAIGYAPKDNYLFYGTVLQNLKFANPTASDEEVEAALQRVSGLKEEIAAMPEGFDTRIKVDSLGRFSGSFLKRLCLARVFLRNSRVLLLDEPEARLSAAEVLRLRDAIAELRGDYTVVLATHEPALFAVADQMLWLESGRVKGWGDALDVAQRYTG
ncbi:MAG: peptidase domain-containing ABC transporter [Methylococcaceae bacterium]|nr:MAG: peptidase domain-containing ABC transporter [Methylococcaceae bacterium]